MCPAAKPFVHSGLDSTFNINSPTNGKVLAFTPAYRKHFTRGVASTGHYRIIITSRCLFLVLLSAAALAFSFGVVLHSVFLSNVIGPYQWVCSDRSCEFVKTDFYNPDRTLCLKNGRQISSLYGQGAYHEALVHPAMIAHPRPKRVAIIGDGEAATLREVLKHNTVEEARLFNFEETYRLESSICTDDVVGSDTESCFDDSRATAAFKGKRQWLIDTKWEEKNMDVVIMDALNPDELAVMLRRLHHDHQFALSLFTQLSEDGVLVVQLGESDESNQPVADMDSTLDQAITALQNAGFQSMHIYDEAHYQFLVSFKNYRSRANWYKNSAEIEIELHKRLHGTTQSGKPSFLLFDALTMVNYQVPSKTHETTYCQKEHTTAECNKVRIDPNILNIPISHLTARKSTMGEFAGRGLFAVKDIPQGSVFDIGSAVKAFRVLPSTWSIIEDMSKWSEDRDDCFYVEDELSSMVAFTEGYGYGAIFLGKKHFTVDATIETFCNHGCNGTYTYGDGGAEFLFTEMTVNLEQAPDFLLNKASNAYSPVFERHLQQIMVVGDKTLHDISKGEEILCDYLSFVGDPDDWEDEVRSLRSQCAGETMGDIAEYEFKTEMSHGMY